MISDTPNHKRPNLTVKVLVGLIILELVGAGVYLYNRPAVLTSPQLEIAPLEKEAASFAISGPESTIKVGETFTAQVSLELTNETAISAIDIIILYDPQYLAVSDSLPQKEGTQVGQDAVFMEYPVNVVEASEGKIILTAYSEEKQDFAKENLLSTISFTALSPGEATVKIDYTPQATNESNVMHWDSEKDILETVGSLDVAIVE